MENKLRNKDKHTQTCMPKPNSHPPALSMHKNSQTISKTKPKIRIIHIFAPQIIKTDVENFRELVQRITGKPSSGEKHCKKKPTIAAGTGGIDNQESRRSNSTQGNGEFWGLDQSRERVKEEVGLCSDESSERYLGGFSDLEGFISSELGEFPLFPFDHGTHLQGFEESRLL